MTDRTKYDIALRRLSDAQGRLADMLEAFLFRAKEYRLSDRLDRAQDRVADCAVAVARAAAVIDIKMAIADRFLRDYDPVDYDASMTALVCELEELERE